MNRTESGLTSLGAIGSVVVCLFTGDASAETFTNTQGTAIEGEVRSADLDAGTVKLFVTKHGKEFDLKLSDLSPESQQKVKDWYEASIPKPAEWVVPGADHFLEFGELGNCNHEAVPLGCNVYVPTSYRPDKEVPLLVWLQGGKGGNRIGGAKLLAGEEQFVCVSLPYPEFEGRDIFARQQDGGLKEFWEVHKVMLAAIDEAIPNLSPQMRVIAGFSNGAHSIGGYCSQVEKEFGEQFNVFVFGDGGVYSGDWSSSVFKGAHAYCTWGEESVNKKMTVATADLCDSAKMEVVRSEMAATGHQFRAEEKEKVKRWLIDTVLPARMMDDPG